MYEVIPGILEKEWGEIERKIELVKPFARTIHIDLLDGKFAPNTSFLDPAPFKKYSQDLFFELHMMVEEPIDYLEKWSKAGFRRFLGHIEKMSDQAEFVAKAEALGEVGLAFDSLTSVGGLKVSFEDLDALLVMTVKAGFSGQAFVEEDLKKVIEISKKTLLPVEIDGGINDLTITKGIFAGANRFVATSYLFSGSDCQLQYKTLKSEIEKSGSQDALV